MEGGTYSRAIEAGFPQDQATFFAHLACDTKNEVYQEIEKRKKLEEEQRASAFKNKVVEVSGGLILIIFGMALGAGLMAW